MPEMVGFRCNACKEELLTSVLNTDEVNERRRRGETVGRILYPRCGSEDVKRVR